MTSENPNITPFDFQGAQVRTILQDGAPWFVAADVCRVLEILNTTDAIGRLDDDERTLVSIEGREINAVSEGGLYALVLGSRKPEAKAFKRWVTHDVLPAIRKTGAYAVVDRLTRKDLAMLLLESELESEKFKAELAAAAPLVAYAAKVQASPTSYPVDTTAKELGLPVVKFREWAQEKYLFRRGRDWLPRAEYQGRGWFEIATRTYKHDGVEFAYHVSLVTGSGRIMLKAAWDKAHALEGAI